MRKLFFALLILSCCNFRLLSQPIIKVYGNDTADSLKTVIQAGRCLQLLDVEEKICVCIRFSNQLPKGVKGITFFQNNINMNGDVGQMLPVYQVRINATLRNSYQQVALAHELIHIKQYAKGELNVIDKRTVIWKETYYKHLNAADRFISPWEQEAYGLDNRLAGMVQNGTAMFPVAQKEEQGEAEKVMELRVFKDKSFNP